MIPVFDYCVPGMAKLVSCVAPKLKGSVTRVPDLGRKSDNYIFKVQNEIVLKLCVSRIESLTDRQYITMTQHISNISYYAHLVFCYKQQYKEILT